MTEEDPRLATVLRSLSGTFHVPAKKQPSLTRWLARCGAKGKWPVESREQHTTALLAELDERGTVCPECYRLTSWWRVD